MTTKTAGTTVKGLVKVLLGLLLWTGLILVLTWWISPILGALTMMFLAFLWTFAIAPRLAGQMVAALVIYFREKRHGD